jgi:protein phosphatase
MANEYGVTGKVAEHLTQAVGVGSVRIDIVIAQPLIGDTFLLCSDGLSKMAKAEEIGDILRTTTSVDEAANALIEKAKAGGGKDNITVIVIRVDDARATSR